MSTCKVKVAALLALGLVGCSGSKPGAEKNAGGTVPTGGAMTGGDATTGGLSTGGQLPTGGVVTTGGLAGTGGAVTGGEGFGGSGGAMRSGGTGGIAVGGSGGAASGGTGELAAGGSGGVASGGTSGTGIGGAVGGGGAGMGGSGGTVGGTGGALGGAGTGGTEPPNPLAHLAASAEEVGLLLANRFEQRPLRYSAIRDIHQFGDAYKDACEWYGALGVAGLTGSESLLDALVTKFEPLKNGFADQMISGENHVDRYVYGIVPLEIFLQTGDETCHDAGLATADRQHEVDMTRGAIDDMFMMTGLQLQAFRASDDESYTNYMAGVMVDYLKAQQPNGLFFHNINEARTHWGRGNGWFAAGMAEVMRNLPTDSPDYQTIEAGYLDMMEGLLEYQSPNGLWYQVLDMPDDPNNWEESSGTGMFTYAMVAGVRRGVLDAETYVPAIEAAWAGLQTKIEPNGDVRDTCVGTWYKSSPQEYMRLTRLTGDGHGQAPVLWVAAELLK